MNSNCPQCDSDFRFKFARTKTIAEDESVVICPICGAWLEQNMYPGKAEFTKYNTYIYIFIPMGSALGLVLNIHWLLTIVFISSFALASIYFLDKKYRKDIDINSWPYWSVFKK